MALHQDIPNCPHAILDPGIRWFPTDEILRETSMDKLMPPLVPVLDASGRAIGMLNLKDMLKVGIV